MKVFFNGRIVEESEAKIPFLDRGVLFGDGLFETMRLYKGKPFRLDRHLSRFHDACRALGFTLVPSDSEIRDAVRELYRLNLGEGDAYCRLTVTGGAYDGSRTLARSGPASSLIVVTPFEPYPGEFYERGMRLIVSEVRRNEGSPLSRLKSTNYLNSLIARQEAKARGADDALMLNNRDVVAEGTASNLFFASQGLIMTPDIECGSLPGITREVVLELCASLGLPVETGFYAVEDVLGAEEVFVTVSTGEIIPVGVVEGISIGERCPGHLTTRLARAYKDLVKKELDV